MSSIGISLIVPVYNVESYLPKCLNSIIDQTYTNYEIIFINDCSTDNSKLILDNFINNFKNKFPIRYLEHTNNLGLGAARNTGLKYVEGKYIYFIDSDDWLEKNALNIFYNTAETGNYDVVCSNAYWVNGEKRKFYNKPMTLELSNFETLERYLSVCEYGTWNVEKYGLSTAVWDKFYKAEIILKNQIRFGILYAQDIPFNIEVFLKSSKIKIIPNALYNYLFRDDSLINKLSYAFKKKYESYLDDIKLYINKRTQMILYVIDLEKKYPELSSINTYPIFIRGLIIHYAIRLLLIPILLISSNEDKNDAFVFFKNNLIKSLFSNISHYKNVDIKENWEFLFFFINHINQKYSSGKTSNEIIYHVVLAEILFRSNGTIDKNILRQWKKVSKLNNFKKHYLLQSVSKDMYNRLKKYNNIIFSNRIEELLYRLLYNILKNLKKIDS